MARIENDLIVEMPSVVVRVRIPRFWTARVWVAGLFIRLACWIANFDLEFNPEAPHG